MSKTWLGLNRRRQETLLLSMFFVVLGPLVATSHGTGDHGEATKASFWLALSMIRVFCVWLHELFYLRMIEKYDFHRVETMR